MKIQTKFIIGILSVLIVSIVVIGIFSISLSSSVLRDKISDNTILLSESYADEVNRQLINYEKAMKTLSSSIVTAINVEDVLMNEQKLYPEIKNLFYTDTLGKIIRLYPYDRELLKEDFSEKDFWKNTIEKGNVTISNVINDFGYPSIVLSAPVFIHFGGESPPEMQGIVNISIPVEDFFEKFNKIIIGETGYIFILDDNGKIVTHKNKEYVQNKTLSQTGKDKILKSIEENMLKQNIGYGLYEERNKDYFIAFAPIERKKWSLGINGVLDEFIKDVNNLAIIILIILVISTIFTIFLVYFIVHSIVKPISSLMNTIKQVQEGNLDAQSNVKSKDEIGKLSIAFNDMTTQLKGSFEKIKDYNEHLEEMVKKRTFELNIANYALNEKNKIMIEELKMAQRVQRSIIPTSNKFPQREELHFGSEYLSMESIGGDLYDILRVGNNRYGFLIADVSGHGVPAALITAMAKVSFSSNSRLGKTTAEICNLVNKEIYEFIGDLEYYITAYYATFDLETGIFQYTNAGHHPAIICHPKENEIEQLDTGGLFIGAFLDVDYETKYVELKEGDKVIFFTDGIVEARNENGDFYEYDRFLDCIIKNMHLPIKKLIEILMKDLNQFCGNRPPNDDRAILSFEFMSKMKSDASIDDVIHIEVVNIEKETNEENEDNKRKDNFKNLYTDALNKLKAGMYKEALKILLQLQIIEPENPKLLNNIGIAYYKLGDYKKAYNLMEDALSKDSSNDKLKRNLKLIRNYIKNETTYL